jgi:hypothetical protein
MCIAVPELTGESVTRMLRMLIYLSMRGRPTHGDDRRSKMGDLSQFRDRALQLAMGSATRADCVSTPSPDRPRVSEHDDVGEDDTFFQFLHGAEGR